MDDVDHQELEAGLDAWLDEEPPPSRRSHAAAVVFFGYGAAGEAAERRHRHELEQAQTRYLDSIADDPTTTPARREGREQRPRRSRGATSRRGPPRPRPETETAA